MQKWIKRVNKVMAVFDLALGTSAIVAPDKTLQALGHEYPSPDAKELFRRCGPIWLTFAAAHIMAEGRGESRDWYALAWLRATEFFTDVLWVSRSSAFRNKPTRNVVTLAGPANLALTLAFLKLAKEAAKK